MKRIAKSLFLTLILSLMFGITCQASVKKVTITSPTKSSTYTVYRTTKNVTKNIKATVTTTSQKDKKTLKYSSSNSKVVSVSSKGKITCKKAGTATITVVSKQTPSKKDKIKIKVIQRATKLAAKTTTGYAIGSSITIAKGKNIGVSIIATPSSASNKVTWKSSNAKIAKVSSTGKITALKTGTAKITATAKDGSKKKVSFKVKVVVGKVTSVSVDKKSVTLVAGKSTTVKATVKTSGSGANKTLVWSSSKPSVATVSNGKIKAVKKGSATITVTSIDGTNRKATVTVKVVSKPVEPPTDKPTDEPTDKPTDEPTDKPTDEPTDKPTDEPTDKPTDEPTDKPTDEPTDKPTDEPTEEPTEKPTEEPTIEPETVVKTVKVNTDKVTNGVTIAGTNTVVWDDEDKAIATANKLTKDTRAAVDEVMGSWGIKVDSKMEGMNIVINNSTYTMKYAEDAWKLYDAAGKEVSIKEKLFSNPITNMKIVKQLTAVQVQTNLARIYAGKNLVDGTYDFGTGVVKTGEKEYKITKCIIAKSKLYLTIDGENVTVDMTGKNEITITGTTSLNGILSSVKSVLGDAITVE